MVGMGEFVMKIAAASVLMALSEAIIPSGNTERIARKAFSLMIVLIIAESLIGLLERGIV